MMTLGKIAYILIISLLLGCSAPKKEQPRVVYVSTPLSLPNKPELPKIPSDSLYCVSDDVKWALLKRDVAIKNYISELETIISSTQKK
jgi:hypothetical protein